MVKQRYCILRHDYTTGKLHPLLWGGQDWEYFALCYAAWELRRQPTRAEHAAYVMKLALS